MNTEELKMVVDMIQSLGENGKEAFVWYLLAQYGLGFLKVVVPVVMLVSAARYVAKLVAEHARADLEKKLTKNRADAANDALHEYWLYTDTTAELTSLWAAWTAHYHKLRGKNQ